MAPIVSCIDGYSKLIAARHRAKPDETQRSVRRRLLFAAAGLVVNMRTAKVLGISIPQSILVRADRVIE